MLDDGVSDQEVDYLKYKWIVEKCIDPRLTILSELAGQLTGGEKVNLDYLEVLIVKTLNQKQAIADGMVSGSCFAYIVYILKKLNINQNQFKVLSSLAKLYSWVAQYYECAVERDAR